MQLILKSKQFQNSRCPLDGVVFFLFTGSFSELNICLLCLTLYRKVNNYVVHEYVYNLVSCRMDGLSIYVCALVTS